MDWMMALARRDRQFCVAHARLQHEKVKMHTLIGFEETETPSEYMQSVSWATGTPSPSEYSNATNVYEYEDCLFALRVTDCRFSC